MFRLHHVVQVSLVFLLHHVVPLVLPAQAGRPCQLHQTVPHHHVSQVSRDYQLRQARRGGPVSLVTLEVLQGRTRLVVRLVQADQYFLLDLAARILRVNQLVQLVPVLLQKPGNLVVNSMRDILPVVRVHFCFNNCSRSTCSTLLCAFTKNCTWRARSAVLAPLAWFASSSLRSNFTTWSL